MQPFQFYHETLIPQVNALKTRSYYIPFSSERFSIDKRQSDCVSVLDRWKFAYYPRYIEGILEKIPQEEFAVPFVWQLKGFDYNQYTNFFYPIPFDPPFVRKDNPCGVYQTEYISKKNGEREYIVFDSVDSCLYLFVNGQFVGYSTVSHCSAEFELTEFLKEGKNDLVVLVFKWCSGTYFEDQDKIRFSGIFRDVYILHRPKDHITDYKITTGIIEKNGANIFFTGDKPARLRLYDGEKLLAEQTGSAITFCIQNAKLWTAETPNVYRIVIEYNGEFIEEFVGIRKVEIKNSVLMLNGKPIKLKGVNRHSMTKDGYVESIELMEEDLKLFKKFNINAVRTSHYPPHPIFAQLCDLYGIYVLEEADIETHGLETIHYYGDPHHFDDFANNHEYRQIYLHRQERMYERDKNRQCIIMWSLGNEAGWGENFKASSEYLHKVDTRPVHYEGNNTRLLPVAEWRDSEYLDVASMMYTAVEDCKERIDKGIGVPFMLCEYAHAMGNSCGDLKGYWDYIYSEERFVGAFVWEWCNHTVLTPDGKILFGGDFHEAEPCSRYDGNFCVDGLMDTDRRPHPSAFELKEVYAPVDVQEGNGVFTIINRYDFLPLDGLQCDAFIECNGVKIKDIPVDISGIVARGEKSFPLPSVTSLGYHTLNFIFSDLNGEQVARRQIFLGGQYLMHEDGGDNTQISHIGENIEIKAAKYIATIDRNGMISSLKVSGKELLKENTSFSLFRAPIDNDLPFIEEWKRTRLQFARTYATGVFVHDNQIIVQGKIVADIVEPLFDFETTYTIFSDKIRVSCIAIRGKWYSTVARFGMKFVLDGTFCQVKYFGRGPGEAYIDRLLSCPVGLYQSSVDKLSFNYVKAQDNGSRCGCRNVTLFDDKNEFIVESEQDFCFTASPFDIQDYKTHSFEMDKNTGKTVLNVDAKMTGVGSAACGAPLNKKYEVNDEKLELNFDIVPFLEKK